MTSKKNQKVSSKVGKSVENTVMVDPPSNLVESPQVEKETPVVNQETLPVVEQETLSVVEKVAQPKSKSKSKGVSKDNKVNVETPVVENELTVESKPVKGKGKGKGKSLDTKVDKVVESKPVEPTEELKTNKVKSKVKKSITKEEPQSKKSKKVKETTGPSETSEVVVKKGKGKGKSKKGLEASSNDDEVETTDRHIRSFKVKLPNKEEFEGRFTGLTPYQAANKALSKFFRESGNIDTDVTFSICESTRKSKKTVYTYTGKRYKLDVPVVYKIEDGENGKEIVKNYKNLLKKVKKADLHPEVEKQQTT
jgi:hypothetical protein